MNRSAADIMLDPVRLRRLFLGMSFLLIGLVTGCRLTLQPSTPTAAMTPLPLPTRIATATPVVVAQATPIPADFLATLSTEEQLLQVVVPTRDLRDLTIRLNPAIDEVPLVVNTVTPDYAIGEQLEFWVHNLDTNRSSPIMAELIYKTEVAYAWVEVGQPYDREAMTRSIDRFSQQSYPAEVAFFGSEWYPGVDNDPRLHILHAMGVGSGVAGYYSSADQYNRLANPYSNEKEMFYINLRWLNNTTDYHYYETVLAHEFQHMIHWANDRNEETWLNEGLSEYAQEVAGYGSDTIFAGAFINLPDTQLNTWKVDSSSNAEHYGSAYLFVNYLTQQYGPETTKALVAQPANGIQGVTAALADQGYAVDFNDVFADWVIANYLDKPDALDQEGTFGYRNLDLPTPPLADTLTSNSTMPLQATVNNYATDYIRVDGVGDVNLRFQGQTTTQLANTQPYSGDRAWWSNRGDDTNSRLTRRFDLSHLAPGTAVTMDVAMWWNIEADYDYGYVAVSRDERKWQIIGGQYTTRENPSGNSFGPAYTGSSNNLATTTQGWVTERFDLSAFAGEPIWVRFEYVTDDAVNASGWFIDDVTIPALDYHSDFETGSDGWLSEGWLLTDNVLAQHWLIQIMEFENDTLMALQRTAVNAQGEASLTLPQLSDNRYVVLAISAYAPTTTEPAAYTIQPEE
ncbi:MAG: immune inhibitor A [Caldilineaceae bacterium]|nr:immune inhibitor A [Caldilineaceae bacterium]